MNHFVKNIHINKLFHLENFDIPIADKKYSHLIITGKNGSGKTVLLKAIADFIDFIMRDTSFQHLQYNRWLKRFEKELQNAKTDDERSKIELQLSNIRSQYDRLYGEVNIEFTNLTNIVNQYQKGNFVIAFYQSDRIVKMIEPDSPQKPQIDEMINIRKTDSDQFICFLIDLKFQELLAISNQDKEREQTIKKWFEEFENLLKQLFEKKDLRLFFDQENKYSFKISTGQQTFGFNEMSDGFKAAINIVADLILKMQHGGRISDGYKKEGVVLIDEIETHLHLGLQKVIMPLLTKVFPNIQFIVTTHSPFVLSSMENAVAFDLEHREPIEDLSDYSYSSLSEGFFGVRSESNTIRMRLDELALLLSKETLSVSEKMNIRLLVEELDKIPEPASPSVVGEYLQMKLKNAEKINKILVL